MSMIDVTVSELRSAASKIKNQIEVYRDANSRVDTTAGNLATMWEGDAHDKFYTEYELYKGYFTKMIAAMESHAAFLETTASKMEEADREAAAKI